MYGFITFIMAIDDHPVLHVHPMVHVSFTWFCQRTYHQGAAGITTFTRLQTKNCPTKMFTLHLYYVHSHYTEDAKKLMCIFQTSSVLYKIDSIISYIPLNWHFHFIRICLIAISCNMVTIKVDCFIRYTSTTGFTIAIIFGH